MDPNIAAAASSAVSPGKLPLLCSYCHQPIELTYYFCPNCGNRLHTAPMSTSLETQAWIYAFSIALPMLCFLFISKWPGLKYYRSEDRKIRAVGLNAIVLLTLSTIVTIWLAYVWTQDEIKSLNNSISQDFSGLETASAHIASAAAGTEHLTATS